MSSGATGPSSLSTQRVDQKIEAGEDPHHNFASVSDDKQKYFSSQCLFPTDIMTSGVHVVRRAQTLGRGSVNCADARLKL